MDAQLAATTLLASSEGAVLKFPLESLFGPIALYAAILLLFALVIGPIKRLLRSFQSIPEFERLHTMSGVEFEKFLRLLLERDGWRVELTPHTGDFGADLILSNGETTVAVQAKRYRKAVGIKAVQEAAAARDYYRTNEAWVMTQSSFTKSAVQQAKASNIRLRDGRWLAKRLAKRDR